MGRPAKYWLKPNTMMMEGLQPGGHGRPPVNIVGKYWRHKLNTTKEVGKNQGVAMAVLHLDDDGHGSRSGLGSGHPACAHG